VVGRGRGVFALRDILPGEEIGQYSPFAVAVAPTWRHHACVWCLSTRPDKRLLHRCLGCDAVRYCSEACVRAAAAEHPPSICSACKGVLQAVQQSGIEADWTAAAAVLAAVVFANPDPAVWTEANRLCRLELVDLDAELCEELKSAAEIAARCLTPSAAVLVKEVTGHSAVDAAFDLLLRAECNTFSYWSTDGAMEQRGLGLYGDAAMFNHDCLPNIAKVFEGRTLKMIAVRSILAGEELCLSYVPLDGSLEERKRVLQRHFHFDCRCRRCKAEECNETNEVAAALANLSHRGCGGVWVPHPDFLTTFCSTCLSRKPDGTVSL